MNIKQYKYLIILAIIVIIIICLYMTMTMKEYENMESFESKLSSVVIIGTVRDIEKYLDLSINKIKMIMGLFRESHVIIYENDSKDKTLDILQKFEKSTPNVRIITEKNVSGSRTQRLAHGRNTLMQEALKLNTEYIVIMDLDDVNASLTESNFLSSFKYKDVDWAVMTANQKNKYYDLWALRTYDNWMPFDCWECTHNDTVDNCVNGRFKKINASEKLIKVKSSFGGLGIYKTKYIKPDFKYNGDSTCEHVAFHNAITNNGGNIYINPNMINS